MASRVTPLVDSHLHLHEYGARWIKYCGEDLVVLAVSDDYLSSLKTLEMSDNCRTVVPAIGIHPWAVKGGEQIEPFEELVRVRRPCFLGEVGLDKRFVPHTIEFQVKVFERFVELAEAYGLGLSVHAAGAWEEVLRVLKRRSVKVAIFHWYTGPTHLLEEIVSLGYYVGLNPAVRFQQKHAEVIKWAPLEALLTESDGPYNYRGLALGPELLEEVVSAVAQIKNVEAEEVKKVVWNNFVRALSALNCRRDIAFKP